MSFRVQGLDPDQFRHLFGASDASLAQAGARRYVVDAKPGFPDRIAVRDLEIGETAILINYEHQPADTPYRSPRDLRIRGGDGTAGPARRDPRGDPQPADIPPCLWT
ncbi:uncharacterized protein DUF1203 [Sphingomonas sp. PP-CE-1A-559]|uniref:DUF1203 domain-containing protein n=1 Tax=Sphingomonas sp. PP-CE-1A-559 TaxID=2135657 RepID=UPI0010CF7346|nr:DUF1203 domain-containing protein [Sphingomonas sp. PP-CE-1A-559]TCP94508.1 uncharacterized protein DUF1203 [Sphingomonas sp. PP-CE-1A-559]